MGAAAVSAAIFPMSLPAKLLLSITLPLYVLDQITKFWTVFRFPPPWAGNSRIEVIPGWVHFQRVHNQGVAFGFGNGTAWAPVVFLIVPLIALTAVTILWRKGFFASAMTRIAAALLASGILGNLTDRLVQGFLLEELRGESFWTRLSNGYVVDFLNVKLPLYDKLVPRYDGWWPAFNVADSCVCIAAVLIFIGGMREENARKKNIAPAES